MGKKSSIAIIVLLGLIATGFFLYSTFIGLERESLAKKLPADTYASLSIRHLRKVGVAFATDQQLQASAQVVQAIAKILGDSLPSIDLPGEDTQIEDELVLSLAKHFKTQLTIAALPPQQSSVAPLEFAVLTDFYGNPDDFKITLDEIARQATSSELGFNWTQENWDNTVLHSLSIASSIEDLELPPIEFCWAILDETLFLCSHKDSLKSLLAHTPEAPNFEQLLRPHQIESYVDAPDITLLVNSEPCLAAYLQIVQNKLITGGGFAAGFSPITFSQELALDRIESFATAIEFTGKRTVYSGVTYNAPIPIFSFLQESPKPLPQLPEKTPIFLSETLNIDSGDTALAIKDAFLKAMPLANFPYFGLRSQIKYESGLELEDVVESAFSPQVTSQHTLDFGTARTPFGEIREQVIWDSAYKFKLADNNQLTSLLESLKARILDSNRFYAYQEGDTIFIDTDRDKTVTSGRIALSYSDNYITIGYGTLKSFKALRDRTEQFDLPAPGSNQVGSGSMITQNLPTTLFQLTAVLYQQVNNTKNIPQAFLDFDWGSLTILEQNRTAAIFKEPGKHLYRVSQQVD